MLSRNVAVSSHRALLTRSTSVCLLRYASSSPCQSSPSHLPRNIDKVLIANRGEIACRVIRTAKLLGIKTVAVFSDADVNSLHVHLADEAIHIGPATSSLSYLNYDKILQLSSRLSVDAIHPGYGFLSENVEFADACAKAGVIFMGPPSSAIRDMGIKSTSKHIMSAAGVPIIPGYHGEDQSMEKLQHEAEKIGYPVMLKAVRGGGGKGMRIVESAKEFKAMLESAQSESLKAFGNSDMLVEKFVVKPRHVEVQVFCDQLGNAVHLFERDCSVQRRHQKIIEEAPAPGVPRDVAMRLGNVAVKAAQAVNYVGAGTVEFVMDEDLNFYFMEMNTRLQVEHPITEMITGVDLVEWQFRVAEGLPLPLTQDQINVNGHSFEARIYAEDPDNNFMPGAGTLTRLVAPQSSPGEVRIETGVSQGDEVTVHYDPLIAKLVVWGQNRNMALRKLASCLDTYQVLGLKTNIEFLKQLSTHEAFVRGDVNTDFIADHYDSLFPKSSSNQNQSKADCLKDHENICKACLALIHLRRRKQCLKSSQSPWSQLSKFRVNSNATETFTLKNPNTNALVKAKVEFDNENSFTIEVDGKKFAANLFSNNYSSSEQIRCQINDHVTSFGAEFLDNTNLSIFPKGSSDILQWIVEPAQALPSALGTSASAMGDRKLLAVAPMTGIIDKILVKVGDSIKANDPLVVMTAMKMEYTIKSPRDGIVKSVLFSSGETVNRHAVIVDIADS